MNGMNSDGFALCDGSEHFGTGGVEMPTGEFGHWKIVLFAASAVPMYWQSALKFTAAVYLEPPGGARAKIPLTEASFGKPGEKAPLHGLVPDRVEVMTGITQEDGHRNSQKLIERLRKYEKCFGAAFTDAGLNEFTCSLGKGFNISQNQVLGELINFESPEMQHTLAECTIMIDSDQLRSGNSKLEILLNFYDNSGHAALDLKVQLCHKKMQKRLTACTQPLYGYPSLERAVQYPGFLQEWLEHHEFLGLDQVVLYDVDGSFEAPVNDWHGTRNAGFLRYFKYWPHRISTALANRSQEAPLCTETFAYLHCLLQERVSSEWLLILHGLDEWLAPLQGVEVSERAKLIGGKTLQHVLAALQKSTPTEIGFRIETFPFAKRLVHGNNLLVGRTHPAFTSQLRSTDPDPFRKLPLVNPRRCDALGPHSCLPSGFSTGYGMVLPIVSPALLRASHFVELFPRDLGRCARMGAGVCGTVDLSILMMVERRKAVNLARKWTSEEEQHYL